MIFDVQRGGPSTGMPTRTQQSDLICAAPMPRTATPSTCCCSRRTRASASSSAPQAFDLADRLQTPVFVMLDLDIGMNERLCEPLAWDDSRSYDRGKVMTAEELEAGKDFGRYLDVDGDGIPYRTYPGTHPTKGAFFTRGTSRDRYARYTEEGARLRRQHAAAAAQVRDRQGPGAAAGARATPTSRRSSASSISARPRRRWTRRSTCSRRDGHHARRAARARLPVPRRASTTSSPSTTACSWSSRTATRRCARCWSTNAASTRRELVPVLHYDGTPITARFIATRDRRPARRRCKVDAAAARPRHDLHRQAQAPSPRAAEERARLHAPRLRRRDLDAVRRLRPRFDQRPRSSRPASSSTSQPHRVAKLSGIGCSSKTPTYFLGNSHGFNSVHGRMPSVLTGANLANRDLIYLGVSGDGDSASIGLGQFAHAMRRGVNMIYIVENNGVYGLTKGQFSATADRGSKSQERRRQHRRRRSTWSRMALQLGATFVARSLLRRQGTARAADQGGDRAPGRRLHRRASRPASPSTTTPARPRASTTCASTTRR